MKKIRILVSVLAAVLLLTTVCSAASLPFDVDAVSALLMEAETGRILYEKNADQSLPPASVTKIMTVLLVMEAIERGDYSLSDIVRISENAASMGGSQIYLKPGEEMSVEDLLKSVLVSSANDAAVALAEHTAGSVEGFVTRMNERAAQLGMTNSHFENPTGLDDSAVNHSTSARDIAIMSRELLKHDEIFKYTTIWMDTIRGGAFGLTNTNRLIRFYNGANGLKTGSTSKAKFCISATAKRDDMQLIAVIMASPNRDVRNEAAKKLLDYGFANYRYVKWQIEEPEPIKVIGGKSGVCRVKCDGFETLLDKSAGTDTGYVIDIPSEISAPVCEGDVIGKIDFTLNGEVIGSGSVIASESIDRLSFGDVIGRLLKKFFLG